jgi:hypothetical protein
MDKIEYFKERKDALKYIFMNQTGKLCILQSYVRYEILLSLESAGFLVINEYGDSYYMTDLGKDYCTEYLFQ